ncbi:MAG: CHRD domain-containing protein [Balneolaceae bacterium]
MKNIIHLLKNKKYAILLLLFFPVFALSCAETGDERSSMEEYSGNFIPPDNEVSTSASGNAIGIFDPETSDLSFEVEWEGLTTPVTNMHFHNEGPVIHGIDGWEAETSGRVSGTVTLSEEEEADLAAGNIYIQIHTEEYPGGEVIAPLTGDGSNNE